MIKTLKITDVGAFMALALILCAASSCVKDPTYNVESLDNIDTEVTMFGSGIQLPLGHTDSIRLADIMKMEGMETLDSILKKDARGNFSISADGTYNLDNVISDMHLDELSRINGSTFSTSMDYKLGDFNKDQFSIEGMSFEYKSDGFGDIDLDKIPMPSFDSKESIKTQLYKFAPSQTDLGEKVGTLEKNSDIFSVGSLKPYIPSETPLDTQIPIQTALQTLSASEVTLSYQQNVSESISFGTEASKIAGVGNFTLKSGGLMKVDLALVNCPLSDGAVTPDMDLDLSSMFVLADATLGKLDLSGLVMNKNNDWSASRQYSITSLAEGFPGYSDGALAVKGLLGIDGKVVISDAKSTPRKINSLDGKKMQLKVTVSLDGVVLDCMDITLGQGVSYSTSIEKSVNINYTLPDAVKSVDTVYFKDDSKITLTLTSGGLSSLKSTDGSKHISIIPDVELTFPDGLKVKEATGGKVTISGKDLYDGSISKEYTLVYLTPKTSGKVLSFEGSVKAEVSAVASGSFSIKNLPKGEQDDLSINAVIGGKAALKDYRVTLDKKELSEKVAINKEFTFSMTGLDDFGSFDISLEGSPKATVSFNVPKTSEMSIVADNLEISLPKIIVVDASKVPGFDIVKNSLTLSGELPSKLEFPIVKLSATPKKDSEGALIVKDTCSVNGYVGISTEKITRATLDFLKENYSKQFKMVEAFIPSMQARDISMTGDFNKSLDYEGKDMVILDAEALKNIPQEVKSISELDLENVNAIIEIKVDSLPDMQGGNFCLKGTRIQLPDFLYGENDSHTLILDDEIPVQDGKTITQKAQLTGIRNLNLEGVKEVTGTIKFTSTLFSKKPSVDVTSLKNTIKANIKIGVGNGASADHPGKIAISKAVVKAGYDMENRQSISFGEIPEELQDEKINLALQPQMRLTLTTNFGAPVSGDFVLTPYIAGKSLEDVTVKGIELPFSKDGKSLSNEYVIGTSSDATIKADLSKLLRRVPDSISVAIKVKLDKEKDCIIYPSAKYTLDMKYSFEVPLSFNDGFSLGTSTDIQVADDIDEFVKMSKGSVTLKGVSSTTLPLGVKCDIQLLDSGESPLSEKASIEIGPSSDGATICRKEFKVALSIKDYENAKPAILRLTFTSSASKDVNINENQFIKLDDLSFTLPKGLTYEAEESENN